MKQLIKINILTIFVSFIIFSLILTNPVQATTPTTIYVFYSQGCGYCGDELEYLGTLDIPELEIKTYEVWHNDENRRLYAQFAEGYDTFDGGQVPRTFIGGIAFIGFSTNSNELVYSSLYKAHIGYQNQIKRAIDYCLAGNCTDPMDIVEGKAQPDEIGKRYDIETGVSEEEENVIKVPFVGKVNLSELSLPAITLVIGLLDGFNPCAMWMLSFLLVLLVNTRSRRQMFLIGGTFILVSGIVYFLFMSAWLNVFLILGYLTILRWIVGIFAMSAGMINIKDFFFFQRGPSLTIPKKWQPGLISRMKSVISASTLPATMIGVVLLAFTINMVELMCTVGFPAIYIRILTMHKLPLLTYYLYLAAYTILYMLDDSIVFTIAVITLTSTAMTKYKVRVLKLIGGILMIVLAILLIANPAALMLG